MLSTCDKKMATAIYYTLTCRQRGFTLSSVISNPGFESVFGQVYSGLPTNFGGKSSGSKKDREKIVDFWFSVTDAFVKWMKYGTDSVMADLDKSDDYRKKNWFIRTFSEYVTCLPALGDVIYVHTKKELDDGFNPVLSAIFSASEEDLRDQVNRSYTKYRDQIKEMYDRFMNSAKDQIISITKGGE